MSVDDTDARTREIAAGHYPRCSTVTGKVAAGLAEVGAALRGTDRSITFVAVESISF